MKEKLAKTGMNISGVICKVSPVFFIVISLLVLSSGFSWANQSVDYLCELGVTYYKMGRYDDALSEFSKALMLEPENRIAANYVNNIFMSEGQPEDSTSSKQAQYASSPDSSPGKQSLEKEKAMNKAFAQAGAMSSEKLEASPEKEESGINLGGLKISGEVQARMGFSSGGDAIWKRANWDLNEYNWRRLSDNAFDHKADTYDPRIYDRLKLNLDTSRDEGFDFHGNITVDPWSFTGKSSKTTVTSAGGDTATAEFKYWSNTGYTVNQTINTAKGNSISFPEVKVTSNKIGAYTVKGNFTLPSTDTFTVPETKIYRQFQPVREMWVDYKQSNLKLRVYPIAYENQALSFDDPLRLSNNRKWWEDSPWIRGWQPGQINNAGTASEDFTKGYWDNSLSSFTRDSEGQRLTALRGFSFDFNPTDETSFETSVASPKTLWQDYPEVDNIISASRLKQRVADNLSLGLTGTTRFAYNNNNQSRLDARNYVGAFDMGYEVVPGLQTNFEVAHSESMYDISTEQYRTSKNGNAYYASIMGRFPFQSIMDTKYGFDGIMPDKEEGRAVQILLSR
ncbi:MAG: tetratricopeptide repeat protein [Candidatus Omnitrophica bacterium]|nr:tetratricopeptide repeat protein [Candidatus Omnitrophota bacterium]